MHPGGRQLTDADESFLVEALREGGGAADEALFAALADKALDRFGESALTADQWQGFYLLNEERLHILLTLPPRKAFSSFVATGTEAHDDLDISAMIGVDGTSNPALVAQHFSEGNMSPLPDSPPQKRARKQRVEFSVSEDETMARFLARFEREERDTSSHFKALCEENPEIRQLPDSCRRYYTRTSNRERLDTLADEFRRMASETGNLDDYAALKNENITVSHLDSFVNESAADGGAPSPSEQPRAYDPDNGDIVISTSGLSNVGQVDPRLDEAGEFVLDEHELDPSFLPQKRKR